MQDDQHGANAPTTCGTMQLTEDALTIIRRYSAELAAGNLAPVARSLQQLLDDATFQSTTTGATHLALTMVLARLFAAQGRLSDAVQRLPQDAITTENAQHAALIYCAFATETAFRGDYSAAFKAALEAHRLAPRDAHIQAYVLDLWVTVVPLLITGRKKNDELPPLVIQQVFHELTQRFIASPGNMPLAHAIAILAEYQATAIDLQVLSDKVAVAEGTAPEEDWDGEYGGSDEWVYDETEDANREGNNAARTDSQSYWQWAIGCWTLLAFENDYWQRRLRQPSTMESDHESTGNHLALLQHTAIKRMRQLHEQLLQIYQPEATRLWDPALAEYHQGCLVQLEIETASAQAVATIAGQSPELLRRVGFLGPIAGVGLLGMLEKAAGLRQLIARMPSTSAHPEQELSSDPLTVLRQCCSPLAAMYSLYRLGKLQAAEDCCRSVSQHHAEAQRFLGALLIERAQAAQTNGNLPEARALCSEVLRLPVDHATALAVFIQLSEARVGQVLHRNSHDFQGALRLAREDLAVVPAAHGLKAIVAQVLRLQAQHLINRMDHQAPHIDEQRSIRSLFNQAWELDPDEQLKERTLAWNALVLAALMRDIKRVTAKDLEEARAIFTFVEQAFPGEAEIVPMQLSLLYGTVDWYFLDEIRIQYLRSNPSAIETLVQYIELIWQLADRTSDRDPEWTGAHIADLAGFAIPVDAIASSVAPYDNGIAIITRGLRLVANYPRLLYVWAEMVRLKAVALIQIEKGFEGQTVSEPTKRAALNLFAQSWSIESADAQRMLLMAEACALIDEYAVAERYAKAALAIDPSHQAAQLLNARLLARPAFAAAQSDVSFAQRLIHQQQYGEAVSFLKRADQTLVSARYSPQWEDFVELHTVIRQNLNVLNQNGYW